MMSSKTLCRCNKEAHYGTIKTICYPNMNGNSRIVINKSNKQLIGTRIKDNKITIGIIGSLWRNKDLKYRLRKIGKTQISSTFQMKFRRSNIKWISKFNILTSNTKMIGLKKTSNSKSNKMIDGFKIITIMFSPLNKIPQEVFGE